MSTAWQLPRRLSGVRPQPPGWVRAFVLADWRSPDEQERLMVAGCGGWLRQDALDWHAERRWHEARNAWYRAHPEADHRLEELIARRAARRSAR